MHRGIAVGEGLTIKYRVCAYVPDKGMSCVIAVKNRTIGGKLVALAVKMCERRNRRISLANPFGECRPRV